MATISVAGTIQRRKHLPIDFNDFGCYDTSRAKFPNCGQDAPAALVDRYMTYRDWLGKLPPEHCHHVSPSYRCRQFRSELSVSLKNRHEKTTGNETHGANWEPHRGRLPYMLKISRRHDVGKCMGLDEPEWQALKAPACPLRQEKTWSDDELRNSLRDQWNSLHGRTLLQGPALLMY